tara:strand:+ start:1472 stop:2737 length:1266 start_codon:yes stop_codon:yes gene_type:complete
MPCPDSGQISISDLVAEFGGSAPHSLSEYYRNAGLVPGNNTNVPTSGEFKLTDCYSAVNEIQHTHSNNDTHANYATIFGSNWASTVPKRVIVPSGVTVGGTSTHAMYLPTGMGGTIVFDISGNVHGHGGSANGGNGGTAIYCAQTSGVTINLNSGGQIKAGGGGGGQGGTGGTGGNGGTGGTGGQGRYDVHGIYRYFKTEAHNITCNALVACRANSSAGNCFGGSFNAWGGSAPPSNWTGTTNSSHWTNYGEGYYGYTYRVSCRSWAYSNGGSGGSGGSSGGAGGAGGAGGVGQGYNQSAGSGSGGSSGAAGGGGSGGSSGGTNAGTGGTGGSRGQGGTGGTGGNGGSFGNSGGNGATGSTGNTGATGNSGANGNYGNGSGGSGGSSGSGGSGGSSGGAAGYYIYNRASITFNNSGTVAGQ